MTARRWQLTLGLLLALLLALAACQGRSGGSQPRTAPHPATPPQLGHLLEEEPTGRYLRVPFPVFFVGDSITKGRAATREANSYRERLITYLRSNYPYYRVSMQGVYGSGLRAADTAAAVRTSPPPMNTKLVVVFIGTNDVSGNFGAHAPTPVAAFAHSYALLLKELRTSAPSAAIVCMSPWWDATESAPYSASMRNACSTAHGQFIDLTTLYANRRYHGPLGIPEDWYRPHWTTDLIHPNDTGQAVIFDRIRTACGL